MDGCLNPYLRCDPRDRLRSDGRRLNEVSERMRLTAGDVQAKEEVAGVRGDFESRFGMQGDSVGLRDKVAIDYLSQVRRGRGIGDEERGFVSGTHLEYEPSIGSSFIYQPTDR